MNIQILIEADIERAPTPSATILNFMPTWFAKGFEMCLLLVSVLRPSGIIIKKRVNETAALMENRYPACFIVKSMFAACKGDVLVHTSNRIEWKRTELESRCWRNLAS